METDFANVVKEIYSDFEVGETVLYVHEPYRGFVKIVGIERDYVIWPFKSTKYAILWPDGVCCWVWGHSIRKMPN